MTDHLAFLQPYLKVGDRSGNLDEDNATPESNTKQNDGSETLVDREIPDEASSVQLIEKPARKKTKGGGDYPDYNNIYE